MADVTANFSVVRYAPLNMINLVIIESDNTVDDGDTVNVNTVLQTAFDTGVQVNTIHTALGVRDPAGTPVAEPPIEPASGAILTISGATDNAVRKYTVYFS